MNYYKYTVVPKSKTPLLQEGIAYLRNLLQMYSLPKILHSLLQILHCGFDRMDSIYKA